MSLTARLTPYAVASYQLFLRFVFPDYNYADIYHLLLTSSSP